MLNRRQILRLSLASGAALATRQLTADQNQPSPSQFGGLKVLGTHVTLQDKIRRKAESDLGFPIHYSAGGSAKILHQASTRPESFDLYEQWSDSIRVLWDAGAIQPIEVSRIKFWDEINPLATKGRLTPDANLGAGDAPYRLLYVQPDGRLGPKPSDRISFLPYVHNADSFGYDTRVVKRGIEYETESWSWMLDPRFKGKVALVNSPSIGVFDAALAVQSKGLMQFDDIGNLTRTELDRLFDILINLKRNGHFRGVWSSVPHSVQLMERGEVVIESMFSPAVASLNGKQIPCSYAAPREGYRGWHGVMCLSSRAPSARMDQAYQYMNWWLSGWPGAFIARQGYYISTPQRSKPFLTHAEFEYWYGGQPASCDLEGTDGRISVKKGSRRSGGSYQTRFSNIAVWNTIMPEYEYSIAKWNEFLLA